MSFTIINKHTSIKQINFKIQMLFYLREDSAGKLALSCQRKCASGAVKLWEQPKLLQLSLAAGVEALPYGTGAFENP